MNLDLSLNETEELLKKAGRDFMRRYAPKLVIQKLQESATGYTEEMWQEAVNMGWLGIIIPERYGGSGNSLTSAGVLYEELGSGPLPGPYYSSGILSSLIMLMAGNEEHRTQIVPYIAKGERIFTLALTEPDYSWEPQSIQTTANKKGNNYLISGRKLFVMDAEAATHFIIVARTGKIDDSGNGVSLFIVDKKSKGISWRQLPGFLTGRAFEIILDSVEVKPSDMLGEKGKGWSALDQAITKAIPILCAYKVGACQFVLEQTLEYSRTRVQFGQAIGRFQRVQDMILNQVNHLDAARWTTYEALWKLDTHRPATESVHLAKAVTSEAYWQVCTLAHQVFSGISYSREHPISFHTRASRYLYNFLGDPSYHKQKLGKLLVV